MTTGTLALTADLLNRIARACGGRPKKAVVDGIVANQDVLFAGGINTVNRLASWCGQALVETDYFKTLKEYGGPSYWRKYEGRADLGNVNPGDGVKFPGRGVFQLTGLDNYERYGKRLGLDLVGDPELAEDPRVSMQTSVLYWNDRGLSSYADKKNDKAISRAVNRGNAKSKKEANHEADRIKAANMAREILSGVPVAKTQPLGLMSSPVPSKVYTDEHQVSLVQNWLKNLGYPEVGTPNGELGPFTKGAIRDYRAEHNLSEGDFIDDELILALATDKTPRELPETRTEATAAEVREKVPEARANFRTKVTAWFGMVGSGIVALVSGVIDKLNDAKEYLDPVKDFFGDIPVWAYAVAGVGLALYLARNAAQSEQASIDAFKTGARR